VPLWRSSCSLGRLTMQLAQPVQAASSSRPAVVGNGANSLQSLTTLRAAWPRPRTLAGARLVFCDLASPSGLTPHSTHSSAVPFSCSPRCVRSVSLATHPNGSSRVRQLSLRVGTTNHATLAGHWSPTVRRGSCGNLGHQWQPMHNSPGFFYSVDSQYKHKLSVTSLNCVPATPCSSRARVDLSFLDPTIADAVVARRPAVLRRIAANVAGRSSHVPMRQAPLRVAHLIHRPCASLISSIGSLQRLSTCRPWPLVAWPPSSSHVIGERALRRLAHWAATEPRARAAPFPCMDPALPACCTPLIGRRRPAGARHCSCPACSRCSFYLHWGTPEELWCSRITCAASPPPRLKGGSASRERGPPRATCCHLLPHAAICCSLLCHRPSVMDRHHPEVVTR